MEVDGSLFKLEIFRKFELDPDTMIWDAIEGLTEKRVMSLGAKDLERLRANIIEANSCWGWLAWTKYEPFVKGHVELHNAIRSAMLISPDFGLSKWSSHIAVEFFLKEWIKAKDKQFPRIHRLSKLAETAEALGLSPLSRSDLKIVECKPEVRYVTGDISKSEAVASHQAAIRICSEVGRGWSQIVHDRICQKLASMQLGCGSKDGLSSGGSGAISSRVNAS